MLENDDMLACSGDGTCTGTCVRGDDGAHPCAQPRAAAQHGRQCVPAAVGHHGCPICPEGAAVQPPGGPGRSTLGCIFCSLGPLLLESSPLHLTSDNHRRVLSVLSAHAERRADDSYWLPGRLQGTESRLDQMTRQLVVRQVAEEVCRYGRLQVSRTTMSRAPFSRATARRHLCRQAAADATCCRSDPFLQNMLDAHLVCSLWQG